MDNWLAIVIAPVATLLAVIIERSFTARAQKTQKAHEAKEAYNRLAIDLLKEEISPILSMTDAVAHTIEKTDGIDLDLRTLLDLNAGGSLDGEIKEKIAALHTLAVNSDVSFNAAIIRAGSLSGDLLDATLSLYENYREILRLVLDLKQPGQYGDYVEDYREKSAGLLVECSSLRESCRTFILDEKQKSAL